MAPPATVTDVPRLIPVYLLIIFARISRPPVEALILKRILCEALKYQYETEQIEPRIGN